MNERPVIGEESENVRQTVIKYEGEMTVEDDLMLVGEMDKMLRNMRAEVKEGEWAVRKEERKGITENERRVRMKRAGEKRREWIIQNDSNDKIRMMQAIMNVIVKAGVETSLKNYDMREIKHEIERVGRLEKVRMMQLEWEMRMRLEKERKVERENRVRKSKRMEFDKM